MKIKHCIFVVMVLAVVYISSASAMSNQEFWQLISLVDAEALGEGYEETSFKKLTKRLSSKSENEIGEFEELLSQYLYKIDGQKWSDESGESSSSADGFLYARCYVVAKGQKFYEAVHRNPSLMPKSSSEWAESLLFVSARAWSESTGNEEGEFELFASVSSETGANEAQW